MSIEGNTSIIKQRLFNQQIAASQFTEPGEIVNWLIAMQAQEFAHAKWAIGLRLPPGATNEKVEKAFNDGAILRTHLMRPTWHFVTPADIRWLLFLTAPRVQAINAYSYPKVELTKSILRRSNDVLTTALEGRNYSTRSALSEVLSKKKIKAEGLRLGYIMMNAELEGVVCSGPRIGKQFTYALLDEMAPLSKTVDRDEALSSFMKRYFITRGPASIQDFANWSGLTMQEAKSGIHSLKNQVQRQLIDNKEYFTCGEPPTLPNKIEDTFLMPDYDEYGMSYKDRSAIFPKAVNKKFPAQSQPWYHSIVIDGIVQGVWQADFEKDCIVVTCNFTRPLTARTKLKVDRALNRYCAFFGKRLEK